ncbi:MAG: hypothetical protein AAF847_08770 [Bacteroidota bacterium]
MQPYKYRTTKNLSTQYLIDTFHLKRVRNSPLLKAWLDMPYEISDAVKTQLERLRDKLDFYGMYYNEGELKWKFLNQFSQL